jgi:hypothetical protein
MNKIKMVVFGICASIFCSSVFVQAATLPEAAKLVPPETVLLVNINDFEQVREQFRNTNVYKLYKDPSMTAIARNIEEKVREKMRQSDEAISEVVFDAKMLLQGRVTMALVFDEQMKLSQEPSLLVMAQWGTSVPKIKEALDKTVSKAVEQGWHRKSEDYRGVTIVTATKEMDSYEVPDYGNFVPNSTGEPPMKTVQPPPEEVHHCFVDDCLIVANKIDLIKFAVAHIKGATSATLATNRNYETTLKALGPHHDIDLYVNMKQIMETLVANDPTGRIKMFIPSLGLDNVASLGFAGAVSRLSGTSFSGKGLLKIDGEKKGIFKILEFESSSVKVPRFLPESSYGIASINLNIKKAFENLVNVLSGISPQIASIMYMPLLPQGPNGEQGVLLKNDVINHLGSEIVIANSISKPVKLGTKPEPYFAIASTNSQALERSLSLLHGAILAQGKPDMKRELLGQTIYFVEIAGFGPFFPQPGNRPMQAPATGTAVSPRIAFTVTDNYVIIGTESSVEQAIRSLNSKDVDVKSVASTKWFGQAKSSIPSTVGWASMEDMAVSGELAWQGIKLNAKENDNDQSISAGVGVNSSIGLHAVTGIGGGLIDFSLLPEFDAVRKYFGVSTAYGVSRPDGIFFEVKYLNPSGNN